MIVTVPRSLMIYPPGYGGATDELTFGFDAPGLMGLRGLGQDDLSDLPSDLTDSGAVSETLYGITPNSGATVTSYDTTSSSAPLTTADENFLTSGSTSTISSGSTSSNSSNSTTAQDIAALGPALTAASKALSTATGPYQIPGTSYIYNPATGQILLNNVAVGTYNPATGQLTALGAVSSLMSYLPIILIVGLAAVFLGGKK